MKLKVTHFKSPAVALKELEPFIRNAKHLYSGKPFGRFGDLRSRELLGNWLICAVLNADRPTASYTFTSDPQGGDGIIRQIQALDDCDGTILADRRTTSPYGLSAGHSASSGKNSTNKPLPSKAHFHLKQGESLTIITPGGGGWGSPPKISK